MRWLVLATLTTVLAACSSDDTGASSSKPIATGGEEKPAPTSAASTPPPPTTTSSSGSTTVEEDTPPPEEHAGDATYYAAGTTGACGIKTPTDKIVAAIGPSLYSKDVCGQCAEVTGPKGSVTVLINDRCAGCKGESLDLATQAFVQIADKSAGRVKITWHYTDCP